MNDRNKLKQRVANPHYLRWKLICNKCYNKKSPSYIGTPYVQFEVDSSWHPDLPDGFENFAKWIESELDKQPGINRLHFRIYRRNMSAGFTKENCIITPMKKIRTGPREKKVTVVKENSINFFESLFGLREKPSSEETRENEIPT